MADLPEAASSERQAIFDEFGMATIVDSGETDVVACRSTLASNAAIRAWSEKWDVAQYGIGTPFRQVFEADGEHVVSFYRLEIPQEALRG